MTVEHGDGVTAFEQSVSGGDAGNAGTDDSDVSHEDCSRA